MTEKGAKQTPAPHSINAEALTLSALASFSTMVMVGFLRPRSMSLTYPQQSTSSSPKTEASAGNENLQPQQTPFIAGS
jgi:hypothetical protein